MTNWVVFVKNKENVTKTKDRKGRLRKNPKGRETNLMGREERTTDEKGNFKT